MYTNYLDKLEALMIRGCKYVSIYANRPLTVVDVLENINLFVNTRYTPSAN